MITDLSPEQLATYRSSVTAPPDFGAFWDSTLSEQGEIDVRVRERPTNLRTITTYDVTFRGFGGQDVHAWLRVPAAIEGPLPAVVQYVGYGGGRGHELENLFWASAGFAHLQMDTRGQGSGWSLGVTPDEAPSQPQVPGVLTRGILDPATYYYRRLFTDAVRAVDAARSLPMVDNERINVVGGSQGGGMSLAVAGLRRDLAGVVAFVPFLCDFPRAVRVTDAFPYREIINYLAVHRGEEEQVFQTLAYFDGVNFAARATAPALFSVALRDAICPSSTVYGAFHNYAGPKEMKVWEYNGHEGGGILDEENALRFLGPAVTA
ncbi:acetylxylan esterase [Paractinoplanes atraurantiacus]|uniref:Cephalosporin-C deacetylase n=1 Tax=Paractinoplanes atraurantiacus TaxID=1036182 RepID=A0A285HZB1_9ACTN|nr:acetylxylan esterase [Actinoplanes atraurantiacus]SNY41062.1 cephalosporin-C deacetylase [Actinoplanes atraurantiacus]